MTTGPDPAPDGSGAGDGGLIPLPGRPGALSSCGGTGAGVGAEKRLVEADPESAGGGIVFSAGRLTVDGGVGVSIVGVPGVRPRSAVEPAPLQPGCVVMVRPVVVAGPPGWYGDAPMVLSGVVVVVPGSGRTVNGCGPEPPGTCWTVAPGAVPVVRPAMPDGVLYVVPGVVVLAVPDPVKRLPV